MDATGRIGRCFGWSLVPADNPVLMVRTFLSFYGSLHRTTFLTSYEAKVGTQRRPGIVAQVGKDGRQVARRDPEPAGQGCAILIDGHGRDQTALPDVVRPIVRQRGIDAIEPPAIDRTAQGKVHRAPAVVGSIIVGGQGAAKVRCGEGGHLVGDTQFDRGVIERADRIRGVLHQ